jgi:nucleotide-binding universal stress UspA family protein
MKKLLVTTDLSIASKAGIRFALQLARQWQNDIELVFLNCFEVVIPTSLHKDRIEKSIQAQHKAQAEKVEKFLSGIFKLRKETPPPHTIAIVDTYNVDQAITDYAQRHHFDLICMSTRGGGVLQKIIGNTASTLLQQSRIPVLVVPQDYRVKAIHSILYASDLENFEREAAKVFQLGQLLATKVQMAHFYNQEQSQPDMGLLREMWHKKYPALDKVVLEPLHKGESFVHHLDALNQKIKPGCIVFFTHTNRTLFDKLFAVSKATDYAFTTRVPMLVFRKIS